MESNGINEMHFCTILIITCKKFWSFFVRMCNAIKPITNRNLYLLYQL